MNDQRIILGMGTGRCGTVSLSAVLSAQEDTSVSHEDRPVLPWYKYQGKSGLAERFARFRRDRTETVVGDVALFNLPYAEEAIKLESDIRIVCLRRDRQEVINSFCNWLDKVHPLPTNHWSKEPATGTYHAPIWSTAFPKYDTPDRAEAIGLYWDEYDRRSEELVSRYSENVRIFDSPDVLNDQKQLSELLSFCGYAKDRQVLEVGTHHNKAESGPEREALASFSADPDDRRRCLVLVPYSSHITEPCERALRELQRRGFPIRRLGEVDNLDLARSQMATNALIRGFEETMWIDPDIGFHPDDVDQLRAHHLPISCGIYPQKGKRELACHLKPGTKQVVFGKEGGLMELDDAELGFMHVRREVYQRLQNELQLPVCNQRIKRPLIPFFQPTFELIDDEQTYLSDGYAFCRRARRCGYKIMADTQIRIGHIGSRTYSWEDAGSEPERFETFTLKFE